MYRLILYPQQGIMQSWDIPLVITIFICLIEIVYIFFYRCEYVISQMLALWYLQKLLNSARTHLANDANAAKKKGEERVNSLNWSMSTWRLSNRMVFLAFTVAWTFLVLASLCKVAYTLECMTHWRQWSWLESCRSVDYLCIHFI